MESTRKLSSFNSQRTKTLYSVPESGLQITAGQRTMSGLIADLTGQTPVLPVISDRSFLDTNTLFSMQVSLNAQKCCNDFFLLWRFLLFELNPSKKKNAAIN